MSEKIAIEIVYALPAEQDQVYLKVNPGTTALEALQQSGLIAKHQLDYTALQPGVFGQFIEWQDSLQDQDRLEIYRPLLGDPKEKRLRKVTRKLPRRCS